MEIDPRRGKLRSLLAQLESAILIRAEAEKEIIRLQNEIQELMEKS